MVESQKSRNQKEDYYAWFPTVEKLAAHEKASAGSQFPHFEVTSSPYNSKWSELP